MSDFIFKERLEKIAGRAKKPRDIILGIVDDILSKTEGISDFSSVRNIDEIIVKSDDINQEWLLDLKVMLILKLSGCSATLNEYADTVVTKAYFDEMLSNNPHLIAESMKSECMSSIASKPRNKYHNEIMEIIKLTWEKHPCGSKNEMIRQILAHYPGKVDESTIKRWIKKSGLTPPKPRKYLKFSLVFPS